MAGVVYSVGIDGTGFQVLHNFLQDNSSDGYSPYTGLSSDGEALFGATLYGPFGSGGGTLFDINTDGSGYAKLKEFYSVQGPNEDGYAPSGELLVIGDTIYGLNGSGGRYGYGVVYALTITEPSTLWLFVTAIAFVSAIKIRARIQAISVNEQQLIQL